MRTELREWVRELLADPDVQEFLLLWLWITLCGIGLAILLCVVWGFGAFWLVLLAVPFCSAGLAGLVLMAG